MSSPLERDIRPSDGALVGLLFALAVIGAVYVEAGALTLLPLPICAVSGYVWAWLGVRHAERERAGWELRDAEIERDGIRRRYKGGQWAGDE